MRVQSQSHPTQGSLHKIVKPADNKRLAAYGDLARHAEVMFEDNDRMLTGEGGPTCGTSRTLWRALS